MTLKKVLQKLDAYERLMRLDKPIGILLLLWPTLTALWLAESGTPHWGFIAIFVMGTVLMRSAGCVLNDIADRNFDGHVRRTHSRPLASGEVKVREAYILAAVLCICAFIFVCFLNRMTIYLSVAALFFAASYPYTKRFFVMPQAYLGIAFSFGILMAFSAIQLELPAIAWWMVAANVLWAIAYDTEYAMVDRVDDLKLGIRSSAIWFGRCDVIAIMSCLATMLLIWWHIGQMAGMHQPFYLAMLVLSVLVIQQYRLIRQRDEKACFQAFMQNHWLGLILFIAVVVDKTMYVGS